MKWIARPVPFAAIYVLLMIPTYILPFMGSNRYTFNTMVAGSGTTDNAVGLFFIHLAVLASLAILAWYRGKAAQKPWLLALPVVAGLFDLLPVLNMIPMIPTGLHLVAIILGVKDDRHPASMQVHAES